MKRIVFTLTALFVFASVAGVVQAEVYSFNSTHTVFRTEGNMLDVQVNGNIVNLPEDAVSAYNNYGAAFTVFNWVLQPGNHYDFSGTLRYSNENYCNSLCIGWNTDNCYFTDYYNNGVVTNTDFTLNCTMPRTGRIPFVERSPGFWAP